MEAQETSDLVTHKLPEHAGEGHVMACLASGGRAVEGMWGCGQPDRCVARYEPIPARIAPSRVGMEGAAPFLPGKS